ncbi:MAG: hypothetical protein IPL47_10975 [Phyllobacteriaceae bacterium]|nr:hypothetical protein [Phyllobacteriaceae bacterium]
MISSRSWGWGERAPLPYKFSILSPASLSVGAIAKRVALSVDNFGYRNINCRMKNRIRISSTQLAFTWIFIFSDIGRAEDIYLKSADFNNIENVYTTIFANHKNLYETRNVERKKRFPLFIIVPGIMGSKLIDNASKKVIWGNVDINFQIIAI